MFKRYLLAVMALILAFSLMSCDTTPSVSDNSTGSGTDNSGTPAVKGYVDPGEMKVRIFKIGKADAILIRTENYIMLIDAGETDDAQEILDYFAEKDIKKIDYFVISIFDDDHVGGAAKIVKEMEIGQVIQANYDEQSDEYNAYVAALAAKSITPVKLDKDMSLTLNDAEVKLLAADRTKYIDYKDENASIVVTVKHGENTFLFASDAQSERLAELVEANLGQFTFLKVPDHGVNNPQSDEFIASVRPLKAAITCSAKNPASSEVINALKDAGSTVYLTANGSIKLTSDGQSLSIKQGSTLEGDE